MSVKNLLLLIFVCVYTPLLAGDLEITKSKGQFKNYYHLEFDLTPDNSVLTVSNVERKPRYSRSNKYSFSAGGQFEVFIKRDNFPVKLIKNRSKFLILRMPWTSSVNEKSELYISEKLKLFHKIKQMHIRKSGKVKVVIELNPYINILSKNPLKIELTKRNMFFRQAHGRYIDYVGNIIQK